MTPQPLMPQSPARPYRAVARETEGSSPSRRRPSWLPAKKDPPTNTVHDSNEAAHSGKKHCQYLVRGDNVAGGVLVGATRGFPVDRGRHHGHLPFCSPRVCIMAVNPRRKEGKSACHGEGSAAGLQLRARFAPAAGYAKDCTGSPVRF
jgi:hypothetical protein